MKIDKFSAVVIGIVLLLLVGAVVTVNLTGNDTPADEYLLGDSPDIPVQNAFIALQKGDVFTAREQYTSRITDEDNPDYAYGPLSTEGGRYDMGDAARRLRILSVEIDENNPDQALVTFEIDTYRQGGPFGSGSSWSNQRTVEVVREEGEWKMDTPEYFY